MNSEIPTGYKSNIVLIFNDESEHLHSLNRALLAGKGSSLSFLLSVQLKGPQ